MFIICEEKTSCAQALEILVHMYEPTLQNLYHNTAFLLVNGFRYLHITKPKFSSIPL
jgi:hypothetical protein